MPICPLRTKLTLNAYRYLRSSSSLSHRQSHPSFQALDRKWAKRWSDASTHNRETTPQKPKYYVLSMFPYPSGSLHIGHLRVYTVSDVLARFRRMQGYETIHPMGWDAFGLPAENAAITRGISPAVWTRDNIANMKQQLLAMNVDFTWDREVNTSDPSYYRWTQWLFLRMYHAGKVYRDSSEVNWDPVDQTVLANEQVDAEGNSWRSGAQVEKRVLVQWFMKITDYAKPLLEDLSTLKGWPEHVKQMQANWIGRSAGAEFDIKLQTSNRSTDKSLSHIQVFTTRPDTFYGVQFLALATTHPLVISTAEMDTNLHKWLTNTDRQTMKDNITGMLLSSINATHPITGASIPIYTASYVLDYGSAAVMGVPAHDTRDYAFWQEYGNGQLSTVIQGPHSTSTVFTQMGLLNDQCGQFSGMTSQQGGKAIIDFAEQQGFGRRKVNWKLRDWLLSRQRYWGCPIPIIHCPSCKIVPVPENQLPVKLPLDLVPTGRGGSPLANHPTWADVSCPCCGQLAKRDTDTMDTFVDSSWYYLRYLDPHNTEQPFSRDKVSALMPVDLYVGGIEHAILHLLYSRFLAKFMAEQGLWDGQKILGEPFTRLVNQGMVHGRAFKDSITGKYIPLEGISQTESAFTVKATGNTATVLYEKMSKSKYNGVDPLLSIERHGADCVRAHMLFSAPVEDVLDWREETIVGMERWLGRVYRLALQHSSSKQEFAGLVLNPKSFSASEKQVWIQVQFYIKAVTEALADTISLNTMVSDLIKLTNFLVKIENDESIGQSLKCWSVGILVRMIGPVAPALGEECWEMLSLDGRSLFEQDWPKHEQVEVHPATHFQCTIQINGKVRLIVDLEQSTWDSDDALLEVLQKSEAAQKWLKGGLRDMPPRRIIRAPNSKGKLVNFVY